MTMKILIYLLALFPAAMVACGNMTVNELQNSRKDVTQNKQIRDNKNSKKISYPEVKRGGKGSEKNSKGMRLREQVMLKVHYMAYICPTGIMT